MNTSIATVTAATTATTATTATKVKNNMNKNETVDYISMLLQSRLSEQASFVKRAESEQSKDEQKELYASAKRAGTHAKYLARMVDNATLVDAVAAQVSVL